MTKVYLVTDEFLRVHVAIARRCAIRKCTDVLCIGVQVACMVVFAVRHQLWWGSFSLLSLAFLLWFWGRTRQRESRELAEFEAMLFWCDPNDGSVHRPEQPHSEREGAKP